MAWARAGAAFCIRWRYPLLALWALPWLIAGQQHHYPHGDWIWVEMGARILVHHHAPPGSGPALHLYADNPIVQMGPPALLAAVPLQWLPPQIESHLAADAMSLLVLPALWFIERAAPSRPTGHLHVRTLFAGLVVVPIWTLEAQKWGHLDDVLALLAAMAAAALVSGGRHEVVAGLVLGTGVAAKPWAVILLPILFAYARPQVARSVLAFIVGALAWWAPFVVAAPTTVHALGTMQLIMVNHPTWQLVGIHGGSPGWIRPLQLGGGLLLSTVLVRKAGWVAVPVVALAWRVTTDPYDWPYYVLGPLLGAALWDVARPTRRALGMVPFATLAAAVAAFWIPREVPGLAAPTRLVWFVALTAAVVVLGRATRRRRSAVVPADPQRVARGADGLRRTPHALV